MFLFIQTIKQEIKGRNTNWCIKNNTNKISFNWITQHFCFCSHFPRVEVDDIRLFPRAHINYFSQILSTNLLKIHHPDSINEQLCAASKLMTSVVLRTFEPFTCSSPKHTCALITPFHQHLHTTHLSGGWIILCRRGQCCLFGYMCTHRDAFRRSSNHHFYSVSYIDESIINDLMIKWLTNLIKFTI